MSRINPIYFLALVVTIFLVSFISLNDKKEQYEKSNKEYEILKVKANDFKEYKKTWFDKNKIIKKIEAIVKNSSFRNEKILKTQDNNLVRIKIESSNPRVLSKFLNRVLNEKFRINKINIQKRSISLEIGLK